MNYEEKYKEALKVIESLYNVVKYQSSSDALLTSQTIEKAFPELRESEDELMRKEAIAIIKQYNIICEREGDKCYTADRVISWLEKQSEKKDTVTPQWMVDFLKDHRMHFATPMDYDEKKETDGKLLAVIKWLEGNPQLEQNHAWSEEDEKLLNYAISLTDDAQIKNFLKSLKDRVQPQPKQEWSEEDKSMYIRTLGILGKCYMGELPTKVEEELEWLKSVELQSHWKPSEEQMEAIKYFIDFHRSQANASTEGWKEFKHLESLINDIEKLRLC